MTSQATTVIQYLEELPDDRKEAISKLRNVILENLPHGFEEQMSYGMIGYVVPFSIYPAGYHCDSKLPLPFMAFASQKNSINYYNMGVYAKTEIQEWFVTEYAKFSTRKLDMGKSCFRFKKTEQIPFELIGELVRKISVNEWIATYESLYKKNK